MLSGGVGLAERAGSAAPDPATPGTRAPATAPAEAGGAAAGAAARPVDAVAALLLADSAPGARLWGFSRVARGARALRGEPGLVFARVLGSGHEGGFGLRPSLSRHGLFAVFDGQAAAEAFLDRSATVAAYRARSRELCTLLLRAWSSRGSWGGQGLAATAPPPGSGEPGALPADTPVAALTRASIHPGRAVRFWAMAPAAQADLAHARGCRLAVGLGEAPLLRQATFSVWDSVQAMDAYARSGAHLAAIRAAAQGGFFTESMFVRFVPLRIQGRWLGRTHGG